MNNLNTWIPKYDSAPGEERGIPVAHVSTSGEHKVTRAADNTVSPAIRRQWILRITSHRCDQQMISRSGIRTSCQLPAHTIWLLPLCRWSVYRAFSALFRLVCSALRRISPRNLSWYWPTRCQSMWKSVRWLLSLPLLQRRWGLQFSSTLPYFYAVTTIMGIKIGALKLDAFIISLLKL